MGFCIFCSLGLGLAAWAVALMRLLYMLRVPVAAAEGVWVFAGRDAALGAADPPARGRLGAGGAGGIGGGRRRVERG